MLARGASDHVRDASASNRTPARCSVAWAATAAAALAAIPVPSCSPPPDSSPAQCGAERIEIHLNRARSFVDQGNPLQAAVEHGKALAIDPVHPETHFALGNLYFEQGLLHAAEIEFAAALASKPAPRTHYRLGQVEVARNRTDMAVLQFEKALDLDPDVEEVHIALGLQLHRLGLLERCLQHFARAHELNPDNLLNRHNLGYAYRVNGRHDDAIRILQSVLQEDANFRRSLFELGEAYAETGREEDARAVLMRLLELEPEHPAARARLDSLGR